MLGKVQMQTKHADMSHKNFLWKCIFLNIHQGHILPYIHKNIFQKSQHNCLCIYNVLQFFYKITLAFVAIPFLLQAYIYSHIKCVSLIFFSFILVIKLNAFKCMSFVMFGKHVLSKKIFFQLPLDLPKLMLTNLRTKVKLTSFTNMLHLYD